MSAECVSILPGASSVLVLPPIGSLWFSVGQCQQCAFVLPGVSGVDHHQHLVFQCWQVSTVCVSVLPGVSGVDPVSYTHLTLPTTCGV